MYAIVHNDYVILTQPKWNSRMFTNVLLEDCEIDRKILLSDEVNVPLIVDENTKILKVSENRPDYNSRIQWLEGPYYTIVDNVVLGSYVIKDLDLDIAKGNLKQLLPPIRYDKENKTIEVAVDLQNFTVSTDRDNRAILTSKILAVTSEESFSWKFNEGWATTTKADLENIIVQINSIVQAAFDWELSKINEIDACLTLAELDLVQIYDVVIEP
jgi:hypothetical protein